MVVRPAMLAISERASSGGPTRWNSLISEPLLSSAAMVASGTLSLRIAAITRRASWRVTCQSSQL